MPAAILFSIIWFLSGLLGAKILFSSNHGIKEEDKISISAFCGLFGPLSLIFSIIFFFTRKYLSKGDNK